jgi:Fe-S cluster biogenesis protein NfuA
MQNEITENPDNVSAVSSEDTAAKTAADALYNRVAAIIEEIRPFVQSDGGDVELLKVEDGVVYVRLVGACVGCPSSIYTLKNGVEARICEELAEIESVEMV